MCICDIPTVYKCVNHIYFVCLDFFYLTVQMIELRALHLLGKYSTTELYFSPGYNYTNFKYY